MSIISMFISLFERKKCYSCGTDGCFICPQCSQKLYQYSPYCYVCKQASEKFLLHSECQQYFPYISEIIVLTRYRQSFIKKGLKQAKYYKKFGFYEELIISQKDFFCLNVDKNAVLIPIPMHFLRKWKRGYNQSEIIAKSLSKICQASVERKLLQKKKYSSQQSKLGVQKRQKNLLGTFALHAHKNIDKNTKIYLIDDIVSSGSTLLECAKVLHQNGYKNISAVCLASD